MRYYTKQHPYYCGIDLHARTMYICILDQNGKTLFHENMAVNAEFLQRAGEPFLPNIVVAVECIFTWHWIADFCRARSIPFVLGHALYMPKSRRWREIRPRIENRER